MFGEGEDAEREAEGQLIKAVSIGTPTFHTMLAQLQQLRHSPPRVPSAAADGAAPAVSAAAMASSMVTYSHVKLQRHLIPSVLGPCLRGPHCG